MFKHFLFFSLIFPYQTSPYISQMKHRHRNDKVYIIIEHKKDKYRLGHSQWRSRCTVRYWTLYTKDGSYPTSWILRVYDFWFTPFSRITAYTKAASIIMGISHRKHMAPSQVARRPSLFKPEFFKHTAIPLVRDTWDLFHKLYTRECELRRHFTGEE